MELRDLSARDEATSWDGADECALPAGFASSLAWAGPGAAPSIGRPIFLHTGWRSGGTWIWSRLRASAQVCGFYEPLHEQAARFRRRDVARMRPGSWQSNHSDTAPYFEEYRELIPARGRGVAGYRARFAFDDFFRGPDAPGDQELEAYLGTLIARSLARGQVPVLKFCRSMGRVGWLESLFPQALHLVVLRDPLAQFRSIQRLLEKQRNRYFALAPLLVLARNARHPAVREAVAALGVTLPPLFSSDIDYAVETCWRHVRRLPADEHYRGFLAFWTLSAAAALDSRAPVIDTDAIGADVGHRRSIEAVLRRQTGEDIWLVPRQEEAVAESVALPPGFAASHEAALQWLQARALRLPAERRAMIAGKLGAGLDVRLAAPRVPGWRMVAPPPVPVRRSALGRLSTRVAVLMARAVQPLRRLHGAVVWRGGVFQPRKAGNA